MKAGFVFLFAYLVQGALVAQSDLNTALGKGNVGGITAYFGDKVELTIGDKEAQVTKAEAAARLSNFFENHIAKGYRQVHTGASKTNEANYTIGELSTDKGTFRVYIYFTQQGQKQVIAELRIEE